MSKGAVFNGKVTYIPGVYTTSIFKTLVGRPAGSGTLAIVGDFPFLEGSQAYFSQTISQLTSIAPMSDQLQMLAKLVFAASSDPNTPGVPLGVYIISPNNTTAAGAVADSTISLTSNIWGALGNQTVVAIAADPDTGGFLVTISNSGQTESIRVPAADDTLLLNYEHPVWAFGANAQKVQAVVAGTDLLTLASAHGWAAEAAVEFFAGPGGTLPAAVSAGTTYYVVSPAGADLKVSTTTPAGTPVDFAAWTPSPIYMKLKSTPVEQRFFDTVSSKTTGTGVEVVQTTTLNQIFVGADDTTTSWAPTGPINGTLSIEADGVLTAGTMLNVKITGRNFLNVPTTEIVAIPKADVEVVGPLVAHITVASFSSADKVSIYSDAGAGDFTGTVAITSRNFPLLNDTNGFNSVALAMRVVNKQAAAGFSATTTSGKTSTTPMSALDTVAAFDLLPTSYSSSVSTFVNAVNSGSSLVTATAVSQVPLGITTEEFFVLTGGSEAVGSTQDWANCLKELESFDIDVVSMLDTSAAYRQQLLDHCTLMEGNGRNDRQGFCGTDSMVSFSALNATMVALQSGHADVLSVFCDDVLLARPDGTSGWYGPEYNALQAAAIAAGNFRTSLTRKRPAVLGHRRNAALMGVNSETDLIRIGINVLATPPGGVARYTRWLTAWLEDESDIRTDAAAVRSRMIMYKALRNALDTLIGELGTSATRGIIESRVIETMDQLVRNGEVTAWLEPTLTVDQLGNTWNVGLEASPNNTILFIGVQSTLTVPSTQS